MLFSRRFSRTCLEGISFNFFVCFIFDWSIGSAPKKEKKYLMLHQNWYRTPVYCELAVSASYMDISRVNVISASPKRESYMVVTHVFAHILLPNAITIITIIFPFIPSSLLNHNNASISHSYESQGYTKPELSVKWWLQKGHLHLIKSNNQIRDFVSFSPWN